MMRFPAQILLVVCLFLFGHCYAQVPVITGQSPNPILSVEDQILTVLLTNLLVVDSDNIYPDDFTLTINPGANYSVSGSSITPALNYNGPLTVSVTVNDGTQNSAPFNLQVSISAQNDAPIITGQQPVATTEDQPLTILFANLLVTDVENTMYPTGFTLSVLPGTNYTIVGSTITPALNFSGTLSVNVQVNDGVDNSNIFPLQVSVSPVNDVPQITNQTPNPLNASEDTPFTISETNLVIVDPDNSVFTMTVLPGTNYTFSGNTVSPSVNFAGALSVNVRVSDGAANSATFAFAVLVGGLNDAPVISGQTPNPISATEDTPFTLLLSNLIVTDPDNSVFTHTVLSGTNYTFSGNTVTPTLNYNGPITVNVMVNDGTANSPSFGVAVQVASVNDAPIITAQNPNPIAATEQTPFTLQLSNLIITDPDNTVFTLTVLGGTNYTFSGNTVTPALNYNGPLTVNVRVNDGSANSATFGVAAQVAGVNDPPTITAQTPNPINATEDTPFTLQLSNLIISDVDNTTFTLSILPGTNYTFSGNTITPTLHYNGSLTVNVMVNDGTVDSPTFGVAVQVAAVNDTPVITGQVPLSTGDGQPITIGFSSLIVSDPDNSYPTGFDLSILSGSNYTVSGFVITPSIGFSGNLPVRVFVNDGTINSAIFFLTIQVNYTNKAPIITGQVPLAVNEDSPITLQVANLVITDPDNNFPADFTLTIQAGSNYTFVGNVVTPSVNFNGTLSVQVIVNDGSLNSAPFNVQVTVNPVNDAPSITAQTPNPITAIEDTPFAIQLSNLIIVDPDNTTFILSVLAGTNYTFSGNTVTPTLHHNGALTVNVKVNDGSLDSPTRALAVLISAVNDAPTITGQTPNPLIATQNVPFTLQLSNLIIADPDNSTFTMTVLPGTNYTFSGTTITPAVNFNGALTVNVKVRDGAVDSPTFGVAVNLGAVNVAPTITGQSPNPLPATEDEPLTILVTHLIINDPDDASFTLTVLAGTNYTFSGNTITPAANYSGALTVNTMVSDGVANSLTYGLAVNVAQVNEPPSFADIPDQRVLRNSAEKTITITGITPGPLESEQLLITATSANTSLVANPIITYNGTATTATLRYQPVANQTGSTIITVKLVDTGLNEITQTFTVDVVDVRFTSTPVLVAVEGEPYEYNIQVTDVSDNLTLVAVQKPVWATFSLLPSPPNAKNRARLSGTPPVSALSSTSVTIQVREGASVLDEQTYTLVVNHRPLIGSFAISLNEDDVYSFTEQQFKNTFTDVDANPFTEIQISALPRHGTLQLNNVPVTVDTKITASAIANLQYIPTLEYSGKDTVYFKASDGLSYSTNSAFISMDILPQNDAPLIANLETDSLKYEIGSEVPALLTPLFLVTDADDDSLVNAEIVFRSQNFNPLNDRLLFTNTTNITGVYNTSTGALLLNGKAPIQEYNLAIQSIQYNYVDLVDIVLTTKAVSISLSDGKNPSITKARYITLTYEFEDLDIPNAFTPNGNGKNDVWNITAAKGVDQYNDARIRIYNKRGSLIFETIGFENQWDGTYHGEKLPVDTYYYTIDLKYNKISYKGAVVILR